MSVISHSGLLPYLSNFSVCDLQLTQFKRCRGVLRWKWLESMMVRENIRRFSSCRTDIGVKNWTIISQLTATQGRLVIYYPLLAQSIQQVFPRSQTAKNKRGTTQHQSTRGWTSYTKKRHIIYLLGEELCLPSGQSTHKKQILIISKVQPSRVNYFFKTYFQWVVNQ